MPKGIGACCVWSSSESLEICKAASASSLSVASRAVFFVALDTFGVLQVLWFYIFPRDAFRSPRNAFSILNVKKCDFNIST